MTIKATLRVPTFEQYAFIEVEMDGTSSDEILAKYQELTNLVKGGTGLPDKEFNAILDRYVWGDGHMEADEYANMNLDQQSIIQIIKRSRKRAEAKTK